jgi:hypothetical protein
MKEGDHKAVLDTDTKTRFRRGGGMGVSVEYVTYCKCHQVSSEVRRQEVWG